MKINNKKNLRIKISWVSSMYFILLLVSLFVTNVEAQKNAFSTKANQKSFGLRKTSSQLVEDCDIAIQKIELINKFSTLDFNPKTKRLENMLIERPIGDLLNSEDLASASTKITVSFQAKFQGPKCFEQRQKIQLLLIGSEKDREVLAPNEDIHSHSDNGEYERVSLYQDEEVFGIDIKFRKLSFQKDVFLTSLLNKRLEKKQLESIAFIFRDPNGRVLATRSVALHLD